MESGRSERLSVASPPRGKSGNSAFRVGLENSRRFREAHAGAAIPQNWEYSRRGLAEAVRVHKSGKNSSREMPTVMARRPLFPAPAVEGFPGKK
jgi:hypothetical protein